MLIAYVDESYDKDFYYMGAAIGTPEQWERVESAFETIRFLTSDAHGTPLDVELHAHEIMGGSGDWSPLRGKHREAAGVYIAALRAVRAAGISYIFRGVNVARLNARYSYPYSPHKVTFGHLLERINGFTTFTGQVEPTIVVADQIATANEHQRAFAGYQAFGTGGYRSSTLDKIDPPINFADSAGSDGLQAVDLATYVHFRRERITTAHPAAQRTLKRQWAEIHPQLHHSWDWWP